jgi:D-xylose transport system ATP-binding protein
VVLISHNLNDVFQVADDIAVLYLGQMVAQVDSHDVSLNEVVELITGGRSARHGRQGDAVTSSTADAAASPSEEA